MNGSTTDSFNQLIVLLNPVCTNYPRAKKMVTLAKQAFEGMPVKILETSPNGNQATTVLLRKNANLLGPKTLLCVAAGDGTVNFVINFLLTDKKLPDAARATVILPLWGGNGNDLAGMINGVPSLAKLKIVLAKGRPVAINPLYCQMTDDGEDTKLFLAASYMGFGASGQISMHMNGPDHRNGKLIRIPGGKVPQAIITAWRALEASQNFLVEESGNHKKIYERTVFNGPRVAKFYRQPVKLLDDYFYVDTWRIKLPVISPLVAILAFRRRSIARSKKHFQKQTSFNIMQPTWFQYDGEVLKIDPSPATSIEIGLFDHPFYALCTKISTATKSDPKRLRQKR